jgi:hypothetical protein
LSVDPTPPHDGDMLDPGDLEDLVAYVARSSSLDPSQARRLIDDVLSYLAESPKDFVRRRHRALQRAGYANDEIFARIDAELGRRRFPAPSFSARQLRRIIYG